MAERSTTDGADAGAEAGANGTATMEAAKAPTDAKAIFAADKTRREGIRARAVAFAGNAEIEKLRITAEDDYVTTPEQFSDAAVKLLAAKAPQTGHVAPPVTIGAEGSDKFRSAVAVSLIDRMRPDLTRAMDGQRGGRIAAALGFESAAAGDKAIRAAKADGVFGMGLSDIAIRCVAAANGGSLGFYGAMRAFRGGDGGMRFMSALSHASSDFPILMSNVANKTLQAAYEATETFWRDIARKGVSTDYKERTIVATSKISKPAKLLEGQTAKLVSFGERKEAILVEAYALKFGFNYQTLRNDDLGGFTRSLNSISEAFTEIADDLILELLGLNAGMGPTMSDGSTLFHANHNNAPTGSALSYAAMQTDFIAFEKQKDFNPEEAAANRRFISVRPEVLLVPTDLRFIAEDLAMQPMVPTGAVSPSAATQRNVFAGRFKPVVTPKLSGTRRYLFSKPGPHAALEVAFLDGNESAQVVEIPMTNPMEMEWQATLPGVGVSAINYETALTNAGQ